MRVGDFSVEVVAVEGGVREIESGHVLARPGQVYKLRLRNHGPLRAVTDISIDGNSVSAGGLLLNAWSVVDLERPIHATERGRFTVIAEGNEAVFGADGGRDNPDLGLIEARFRRELPTPRRPEPPVTSPRWERLEFGSPARRMGISSFHRELDAPAQPEILEDRPHAPSFGDDVERAAGTGLTGTSDQEFMPVHIGPLESDATVVRIRLVIGSEEAIAAPRPLPGALSTPARPAARP